MMKWSFVLLAASLITALKGENDEGKVVCYYTNWSVYRTTDKFTPSNIDPFLCTHVIYAFTGVNPKTSEIVSIDSYQDFEKGGIKEFNELKKKNKNLKTLTAVGGWNAGSGKFSEVAASKEKRALLAKNMVSFLRKNDFDGVNLDWQFPGFRDGNVNDFNTFVELLKELNDAFNAESVPVKKRLLLTTSVPSNIDYIEGGYDLTNLHKYVDFITVLCYDYHLSTEPFVNHHSPIYPLKNEVNDHPNARKNIDSTINFVVKRGVPSQKLILGIPAFGRTFVLEDANAYQIESAAEKEGKGGSSSRGAEGGYKAYYEICNLVKEDGWKIERVNETAVGPFAHKEKDWIGYDDEISAKLKGKYAKQHNLGGVMFWNVDSDDFKGACTGKPYPLINAAKEGFFGSDTAAKAVENKTS